MSDIVSIRVDGIAFGGESVGTVLDLIKSGAAIPEGNTLSSNPSIKGKRAFVAGAIPGETIEATVIENQARRIIAELTEVKDPSTDRVTPKCSVFAECGGCQLQFMNIEAQRQAKLEMVSNMLEKQGQLLPSSGISYIAGNSDLPSWEYRRKIILHLAEDGRLGFFREKTSDVVEFDHCHIARPILNEFLQKAKHILVGLSAKIAKITLEEDDNKIALLLECRHDVSGIPYGLNELANKIGRDHLSCIRLLVAGKPRANWLPEPENNSPDASSNSGSVSFRAGHFSQVNPLANQLLVEQVVSLLSSEKEVLELYAGAGNFSFPLVKAGVELVAVEVDPTLVKSARYTASAQGVSKKITFHQVSVEKFIKLKKGSKAVLLDPPRAGAKEFAQKAENIALGRIVYVSCALPTFLRDAKLLSQTHILTKVWLLDMFPQTYHVELVAEFRKK